METIYLLLLNHRNKDHSFKKKENKIEKKIKIIKIEK